MTVLKLIDDTCWLALTTERLRVPLAHLFSQNRRASRISAGRVSVGMLYQRSNTPVGETLND